MPLKRFSVSFAKTVSHATDIFPSLVDSHHLSEMYHVLWNFVLLMAKKPLYKAEVQKVSQYI